MKAIFLTPNPSEPSLIPRCRLGSKHCLIILVTSCPIFARGGGCFAFFLSLVDFSNRTLEPAH